MARRSGGGRNYSSSSEEEDTERNSISFRHFLQPQSDVVPRLNNRPSPRSGNVESSALPDFLASFSSSNDLIPAPQQNNPPIIPNAEELGAYGPIVPNSSTTTSLPDFLSDGPLNYNTSSPADQNHTTSPQDSFPNSNTLRQVERLSREIQERDRRIGELERVVAEQKAELLGLYEQLEIIRTNNLDQLEPSNTSTSNLNSTHPSSAIVSQVADRASVLLMELMTEINRLKKEGEGGGSGSSSGKKS